MTMIMSHNKSHKKAFTKKDMIAYCLTNLHQNLNKERNNKCQLLKIVMPSQITFDKFDLTK